MSAWAGANKTTLAAVNIMQMGIIRLYICIYIYILELCIYIYVLYYIYNRIWIRPMRGVNRRTHSEPFFRELAC